MSNEIKNMLDLYFIVLGKKQMPDEPNLLYDFNLINNFYVKFLFEFFNKIKNNFIIKDNIFKCFFNNIYIVEQCTNNIYPFFNQKNAKIVKKHNYKFFEKINEINQVCLYEYGNCNFMKNNNFIFFYIYNNDAKHVTSLKIIKHYEKFYIFT